MCSSHESPDEAGPSTSSSYNKWGWSETDTPPDWEDIELPPAHVLKHLTDAHCHPTDLNITPGEYDTVGLGGIAAMGTVVGDQGKVRRLGEERGWRVRVPNERECLGKVSEGSREGPRVISCFGYHPWFTHRYTLVDPPPSKEDHYTSLYFPSESVRNSNSNSKSYATFQSLLRYFPDPIPFQPLLDDLRLNIEHSLAERRLTMLGEVGLDGGARMRWPPDARHLYEEKYPSTQGNDGHGNGNDESDQFEPWTRLTPFKVPMSHQKAIVMAQMEVAIECGVNVSFHSVAAAGPTMDVLTSLKKKHGTRFVDRVNVDIHSGGGWAPEYWKQAETSLLNLYTSPSIFITPRSRSAPELIRAVHPDRLLIESDSHDVRLSTRAVWAAVKWVAGCRGEGWKVEDDDAEWERVADDKKLEEGESASKSGGGDDTKSGDIEKDRMESNTPIGGSKGEVDANATGDTASRAVKVDGKKQQQKKKKKRGPGGVRDTDGRIWTVRTLERNWARFMRLIDDVEE